MCLLKISYTNVVVFPKFTLQGPEDSKFILNFNSFKVEATGSGECVSAVEIRSRLPGQPEIKYVFEQEI